MCNTGLFFIILMLCVVVPLVSSDKRQIDISEAPELFEKFRKDYKRQYKDENDRKVHYDAFVANLLEINSLNADSDSATFGINMFADYTKEEKKRALGFKRYDDVRKIDISQAPNLFEKFIKDYKRKYENENDRKVHYNAFVANLHEINTRNAVSDSATFGINKFADYTQEEKKRTL